jgi:hypothetical protein
VLCCAGHKHLLRTQAGAGQALEQPTTTAQQVGLPRTSSCAHVTRHSNQGARPSYNLAICISAGMPWCACTIGVSSAVAAHVQFFAVPLLGKCSSKPLWVVLLAGGVSSPVEGSCSCSSLQSNSNSWRQSALPNGARVYSGACNRVGDCSAPGSQTAAAADQVALPQLSRQWSATPAIQMQQHQDQQQRRRLRVCSSGAQA